MKSNFYISKRTWGRLVSTLTLILVLTPLAQAETIFEGYFKIMLGGKHSGFVVQRYEYDTKKKIYKSIYYNQATGAGGNIAESLSATANSQFEPISYQYTVKRNQEHLIIDASFRGRNMTAVISNGKKKSTITKKLPKGTFLSTFLSYMILTSEYVEGKAKGYKVGKKFNFSAISEEDAEVYSGQVFVESKTPHRGLQAFKVYNTFKGTKYVGFVAENGDVLGTKSPVQQVATELAASPAIATAGFKVPSKTLQTLFGRVPTGQLNVLAKRAKGK